MAPRPRYARRPSSLPTEPMRFQNVAIIGLAHVEAPHRITSAEIDDRLRPLTDRLGMAPGVLEGVAGIVARRFFDPGVPPSQVATMAAEIALERAGIPRERFGILVNTSVCRDYLEPSTACMVHGNLKMPEQCRNYDVGNACLGFLSGMELVGAMLESGQIDYALVVDGEHSRDVTESTIERLLRPETTMETYRNEFAALTLGSGAAAMVLARASDHPEGHRFLGGVTLAATKYNHLCVGQPDRMYTDTKGLLLAGVTLATKTLAATVERLGWNVDDLDEFVLHQVSKVHTESLCSRLKISTDKVLRVYPEYGNIGPAGIPYVLSSSAEAGRMSKGTRVALMGIGSGLNCTMAEVVW